MKIEDKKLKKYKINYELKKKIKVLKSSYIIIQLLDIFVLFNKTKYTSNK